MAFVARKRESREWKGEGSAFIVNTRNISALYTSAFLYPRLKPFFLFLFFTLPFLLRPFLQVFHCEKLLIEIGVIREVKVWGSFSFHVFLWGLAYVFFIYSDVIYKMAPWVRNFILELMIVFDRNKFRE